MYVFAREGLDDPTEGADQYDCVDWLKVYESSWDSSDWKLIEQTQLHTENTDYITDHMLSGILRYK